MFSQGRMHVIVFKIYFMQKNNKYVNREKTYIISWNTGSIFKEFLKESHKNFTHR